jgi:hypothetical protein
MCCTAQTKFKLTVKLFASCFFTEGGLYEYRHRTLIGIGLRHFNFADAQVFELFRRRVFDRSRHFRVDAPSVDMSWMVISVETQSF